MFFEHDPVAGGGLLEGRRQRETKRTACRMRKDGEMPSTNHLEKKVAVVAGATRGAGRGIARMLGEAGATVYCTGRSSRTRPNPTPGHHAGRPETIEETAEMVAAAGGIGIPVRDRPRSGGGRRGSLRPGRARTAATRRAGERHHRSAGLMEGISRRIRRATGGRTSTAGSGHMSRPPGTRRSSWSSVAPV